MIRSRTAFDRIWKWPTAIANVPAAECAPASAVGTMRPVGGDGDLRPFDRLVFSRGIGQHIAMPLGVSANDENAGFIGLLTRARRRIDRR